MVGGWFIGHFTPSVMQTDAFEVGVKRYQKGDVEEAHLHRIATETTVFVSGRARMFGEVYGPGDIVVIEPGEATAFEALDDVVTVVVKSPSVRNDKFVVDESA
jgi:quercetin dioxygenase-like cupin family protein